MRFQSKLGGAMIACAIALAGANASAQDGGVPARATPAEQAQRMQQRIEQRMQKLTQALRLTAQQQQQIRQVLTNSARRMQEMRARTQPATPESAAARIRLRWDTDDRIHAILTCDQREQLRRFRREQRMQRLGAGGGGFGRGRHGGGRAPFGRGAGPARVHDDPDLDDE